MLARCCAVAGVTLLLLFFYSPQNNASRPWLGLFGALAIATITQSRTRHE